VRWSKDHASTVLDRIGGTHVDMWTLQHDAHHSRSSNKPRGGAAFLAASRSIAGHLDTPARSDPVVAVDDRASVFPTGRRHVGYSYSLGARSNSRTVQFA